MSEHRSNLCDICQNLDIQALLLAAESDGSQPNSDNGYAHPTVPDFYQHQPNLASLKLSAHSCDLCSAIWQDCARQRAPSELIDAALQQGLGVEQIYIGALAGPANISAAPNVIVHQHSSSSVASRSRWLACFEVCADYSPLSVPFDSSERGCD